MTRRVNDNGYIYAVVLLRKLKKLIMRNNCEAGCKYFSGGEIRHHQDCVNYEESFSQMYDVLKAKYDALNNTNVIDGIIDSYAIHNVIMSVEPGGYLSNKLEWRSQVLYKKDGKWLGRHNEGHKTWLSAWNQAKIDAEDIKRNYL